MEPVMATPVRSRWVPAFFDKKWVPVLLALVLFMVSGLDLYLNTYTRIKPHHVGLVAMVLAVGMGVGFLLWATPWALAGRIFRHQTRFAAHMAIPLLATLVLSFLFTATDPIVFMLDLDRWSLWISLVLYGAMGIWVLFAHLHLVSELHPRKLFFVSVLIVGIFSGILSVGVGFVNRYVSRQSMLPFSLYPPAFMVLPGKTIEDYMPLLKSIQANVDEDAKKLATEQSSSPK